MVDSLSKVGVEEAGLWVTAEESLKPAAMNIYKSAGFKVERSDPDRMFLKNIRPKSRSRKEGLLWRLRH